MQQTLSAKWITQLGNGADPENNQIVNTHNIATDLSNNIYVIGEITGQIATMYDASGSSYVKTSTTVVNTDVAQGYTVLISKYNSNGQLIWVTKVSAPIQALFGADIKVDTSNNVYALISYYSAVTIYDVSGSTLVPSGISVPIPPSNRPSALLIKYNSSGVSQWATICTGVALLSGAAKLFLSLDSSNNVYLSGLYSVTYPVTIYDVSGSTCVVSTNSITTFTSNYSAFIVKYDPTGISQWRNNMNTNYITNLIISKVRCINGSIYIYGSYVKLLLFEGGTGSTSTPSSYSVLNSPTNNYSSTFLVKMSQSTGAIELATCVLQDSGNNCYSNGMAIDSSENIYIDMYVTHGVPIIYDASGTTQTASSLSVDFPSGDTTLIVKYNSSGVSQLYTYILYATSALGIECDSSNNIIVGAKTADTTMNEIYDSSGGSVVLSSFGFAASTGTSLFVKYNSLGICIGTFNISNTDAELFRDNVNLVMDTSDNLIILNTTTDTTFDVNIYDSSGSTTVLSGKQIPANSLGSYTQLFFTKYNSSGISQWLTTISIDNNGQTYSDAYLKTIPDNSGNIYVVNKITTLKLIPYDASGSSSTPSTTTYSSVRHNNIAVFKYDSSGNVIWYTFITSNIGSPTTWINEVAIDSQNNLLLFGAAQQESIVTFYDANPDPSGSPISSFVISNPDMKTVFFVAKYSSEGSIQYYVPVQTIDYPAITGSYGTVDSSDNFYLVGAAYSDATIYDASGGTPTPSTLTLVSLPPSSSFIVKYNSSGVAQWVTIIPYTSNPIITVDSSNNIIFASIITNTLTPYNALGTNYTISEYSYTLTGAQVIALVKYNSDGQTQWITSIDAAAGVAYYYLFGLKCDTNNNIYVTHSQTSDLSNALYYDASGTTAVISSYELHYLGYALGLVKYNTNGITQWVTKVDGLTDFISLTFANADITTDSDNNIYISTNFTCDISLNPYDASGTSQVPSSITINTANNDSIYSSALIKYNSSGIAQSRYDSYSIYDIKFRSVCSTKYGDIFCAGYVTAYNAPIYDPSDNIVLTSSQEGTGTITNLFKLRSSPNFISVTSSDALKTSLFYSQDGDFINVLGSIIGMVSDNYYLCKVFQPTSTGPITVYFSDGFLDGVAVSLTLTNAQVGLKFLMGMLSTTNAPIHDGAGGNFYQIFFIKVMDQSGNYVTVFDGVSPHPDPLEFQLVAPNAVLAGLNSLFMYRFDVSGSTTIKSLITNAIYNTLTGSYDFTLTSNSTYGGGGEPHIVPVIRPESGKTYYDLPNIDGSSWRLLDYNKLIVNCSTKKLTYADFPEYIYTTNNTIQKAKTIDHITDMTYFDKLFIRYNNSRLIMDVETQEIKILDKENVFELYHDNRQYKLNLSGDQKTVYPKTDTSKYTKVKINMGSQYITLEIYSDIQTDDRSNIRIAETNIDLMKIRGCFYSEKDLRQLHSLADISSIYTKQILKGPTFLGNVLTNKLRHVKKSKYKPQSC